MTHSRLLMAAALASSLGLPVAVHAQVANGGSNYGIFGGGTTQGGGGFGSSSSGQQGFGSAAGGSFGRSSATAVGGTPTLSPYLNLARTGNAAVNYYALVRPQIRQDAINTQVGTTIQQTDRLLNSHQQTGRQAYDPYAANNELPANAVPANSRNPESAAPAAQRRRSSDDAEVGFNDWASGKDLGLTGDVRTAEDARQRAASLRRAKELKALEDELSGNADSSTTPPARTAAVQPTYPPGLAAALRPANHYFPQATGTQVNHANSPPRTNSPPR